MIGIFASASRAFSMVSSCFGVSFLKSFIYERLSSICSTLDMPESTVTSPSRFAANRTAHDAQEDSGSAAFRISLTLSGGFASMPPLTGSMMMTGLSYFRAVS